MSIKLVEIREDQQRIVSICKAAQERVSVEDNIDVSPAEGLATVAYEYLSEAISVVNSTKSEDGSSEVDVVGIFTLGITHRQGDDDAEKEGNYTPYVKPGPLFELIVRENQGVEALDITEQQLKIAQGTLRRLKNRGIALDDATSIAKITRATLIELALLINESRSQSEDEEINLLQLIDAGVSYDEVNSEFIPYARPGQEFKLLVKDDDATEEE
jgi:hypothetical protein